MALDGEVCTKEALPVAEVLARKGAEGRRANHGKDDEKEHQQPRQGRTNHLLWTSTGRERARKKRTREESEQDGRRQDDRGLRYQKPPCMCEPHTGDIPSRLSALMDLAAGAKRSSTCCADLNREAEVVLVASEADAFERYP